MDRGRLDSSAFSQLRHIFVSNFLCINMTAKEIVTFQLGHFSNFVGSHWWNLQVSYSAVVWMSDNRALSLSESPWFSFPVRFGGQYLQVK